MHPEHHGNAPAGGDNGAGSLERAWSLPVLGSDTLPGGLLSAALAFWRRLKPETGGLPGFDSFDPRQLPPSVLPHAALLGGFDAEGRVRGLFLGTVAAMHAGAELAGHRLDELYPPATYARVEQTLRTVEILRRPVLASVSFGVDGVRLLDSDRLCLPLQGADGAVAGFVVVMDYRPTDAGRAQPLKLLGDAPELLRCDLFRVMLRRASQE